MISYAPTYPLWSDNAGKMRYVRVPRGQPITFDRAEQSLDIPPNTRFYKTFLKQVRDTGGNLTYRKIETRLIVSRPDTSPMTVKQQNALYGTYLWNDDESQAQLLHDPLRDGKPFADRIFSYVTDESKAQAIMATNPANLPAAEDAAGITRHYAVPGSSGASSATWAAPAKASSSGSRRCRSRAGQPAPGASTRQPTATS